jgi:hypothetical protein
VGEVVSEVEVVLDLSVKGVEELLAVGGSVIEISLIGGFHKGKILTLVQSLIAPPTRGDPYLKPTFSSQVAPAVWKLETALNERA